MTSGFSFIGLLGFSGWAFLVDELDWVALFRCSNTGCRLPCCASIHNQRTRSVGWHLLVFTLAAHGLLGFGGDCSGGQHCRRKCFSLSEWISPDPLAALEMHRQAHIQVALNPERLVPPPALPPSLFMGSERPALETADRDWEAQFALHTARLASLVASSGAGLSVRVA